jgi:hypothetical protein
MANGWAEAMTPGNLVRAVASAVRIPVSVVTQHDRRLSEAGLRIKGGRGASAPDVGPDDAAKLLIAILTSFGGIDTEAKTASLVTQLWEAPLWDGTFVPSPTDVPMAERQKEKFEALNRLRSSLSFPKLRKAVSDADCRFGAALTALFDDCINGEMESFLGCTADHFGRISPMLRRDTFQLKVTRPWAEARIGFSAGRESCLEFLFAGTIGADTNSEVTTTHEMTAIPLIHITARMRGQKTITDEIRRG